MPSLSAFLVLSVFGTYLTKRSSNAEAVWTREQMAYHDSIKTHYEGQIDELKTELSNLKHSFREAGCSKEIKKDIEDKRKKQRSSLNDTMAVAFYVHLSANSNVNNDQAIAYDVVRLNVGNGYNSFSGQFQAPVAGIYHFSNTVMAIPGHAIHVEIVKNGITIGKNYADHNGFESGAVSVIADLNAGDLVWVKNSEKGLESLVHDYNSFTGFFISP